jgi:hypothetical protein
MRVIVALALGILIAIAVAGAWGIWIIVWLDSPTEMDLAVVPHKGLRAGNVHLGNAMRVIVALVLGILVATTVVSAWEIWTIVTSEIG